MKQLNLLLIIGLLHFNPHVQAQMCTTPSSSTTIENGSIRAGINNDGSLFDNNSTATFQYDYSNNNNAPSTIYTSSFWMGSYDGGGNLLLAAHLYGQQGNDYFAGPLDPINGTADSLSCQRYDRIWKVNRQAIDLFIQDYNDDGVVQNPDSNLLKWPGRNNPNFQAIYGVALPLNEDMAPFYDSNGDGNYNPYDGDYPVFDETDPLAIAEDMSWSVYNDNGNLHTQSYGQSAFMEMHQLVYTLNCPSTPVLNRTVFTKHKLVNRNNMEMLDVKAGFFVDFDLGTYNDDYIGTDSAMNCIFAYNGDNDDSGPLGPGFGPKPPVQSAVLLNRNLEGSIVFENSSDPLDGTPSSSIQFYNYLDGKNLAGQQLPYTYAYNDNPTGSGTNSMVAQAAPANDYRTLMNFTIDTIHPGTVHEFDMAYVYHRDTTLADNIAMTQLVYSEVPQVQNYYDIGYPAGCFPAQALAVQAALAPQPIAHRLFPNPNYGYFQLEIANESTCQFRLINVAGQVVHQEQLPPQKLHEIQVNQLPAGFYFYELEDQAGQRSTSKIQIMN